MLYIDLDEVLVPGEGLWNVVSKSASKGSRSSGMLTSLAFAARTRYYSVYMEFLAQCGSLRWHVGSPWSMSNLWPRRELSLEHSCSSAEVRADLRLQGWQAGNDLRLLAAVRLVDANAVSLALLMFGCTFSVPR